MTASEIKAWRIAHKMNQSELAAKLPVSVYTLRGWEQGRFEAPEYLERALQSVSSEVMTDETKNKSKTG